MNSQTNPIALTVNSTAPSKRNPRTVKANVPVESTTTTTATTVTRYRLTEEQRESALERTANRMMDAALYPLGETPDPAAAINVLMDLEADLGTAYAVLDRVHRATGHELCIEVRHQKNDLQFMVECVTVRMGEFDRYTGLWGTLKAEREAKQTKDAAKKAKRDKKLPSSLTRVPASK